MDFKKIKFFLAMFFFGKINTFKKKKRKQKTIFITSYNTLGKGTQRNSSIFKCKQLMNPYILPLVVAQSDYRQAKTASGSNA